MQKEAQNIPSDWLVSLQSKDELRQFSDLLDSAFSVPPGHHFLQDFPVWDPQFGTLFAERWGILDQGVLKSCGGYRIVHLKSGPGQSLKLGLIGGVATHSRYRGLGLASRVVEEMIRRIKVEGASAVLLWSSEHSMYQRLGFKLCGQQVQMPLKSLPLPLVSQSHHRRTLRTGWTPRLFPMLQNRKGGFILNSIDLKWMSAHSNVQWFYIEEGGQILAYAAWGRGIDLKNLVHEWGGDLQALYDILCSISQIYPDTLILGSPQNLSDLGFRVQKEQVEYLCLAKVIDPVSGPAILDPDFPLWVWGLDAA